MDYSGYVKKEKSRLSALSCLGKQLILSRFAGCGSCSAQQMFIAAFTDTHLLPTASIPVPGPLSPEDL